MKIIFLVPVVPPTINGIGEYTYLLAEYLRRKGLDAHILTSVGQKRLETWIHPVISNWNPRQISAQIKPFAPDWVSLQYVPQLYHPQGLCWNLSGLMQSLRRELKCKTSVTFHEFICAWKFSLKSLVLSSLMRLQTARLLRHLDLAVTTCAVYEQILKRFSHSVRTITIPVGANIPPAPIRSEEISNLRVKHGLPSKKILSIFGRFSTFRNYGISLDILKESNRQNIPAVLLIIGCVRSSNPPLFESFIRKTSEEGLSSQIIETGDLTPEQISHYLSLTDVFVFPQADGISTRNTTVISALAHGLPIIAYKPRPGDFDGYEIPLGRTAERGDEKAFVQGALHLVLRNTDTSTRKQIADYYLSHFSWEHITDCYLAGFRNS